MVIMRKQTSVQCKLLVLEKLCNGGLNMDVYLLSPVCLLVLWPATLARSPTSHHMIYIIMLSTRPQIILDGIWRPTKVWMLLSILCHDEKHAAPTVSVTAQVFMWWEEKLIEWQLERVFLLLAYFPSYTVQKIYTCCINVYKDALKTSSCLFFLRFCFWLSGYSVQFIHI